MPNIRVICSSQQVYLQILYSLIHMSLILLDTIFTVSQCFLKLYASTQNPLSCLAKIHKPTCSAVCSLRPEAIFLRACSLLEA